MRFVLSQHFESLVENLAGSIEKLSPSKGFAKQWIFVPNLSFKSWLMLKMAKYSSGGGVAGCKIITIDEMLSQKFGTVPTLTNMRCWIYEALSEVSALEVTTFLSSQGEAKIELSNHLADLFFSYMKNGLQFPEPQDWQSALFVKFFKQTGFQSFKDLLILDDFSFSDSIHCFGFDFLPPMYWAFFSRFPSCLVYLFSPSIHFWEDICSDRELRKLSKVWKRQGVKEAERSYLEQYYSQMPSLLANLGKLGRETLKILHDLSWESEELYGPLDEKKTALHCLQSEILLFEKLAVDESMEVFKASSLLKEVEYLSEKMIFLVSSQGLLFSDILVLSPDIEPYIPLIQFVFSKKGIPYRFSLVNLGNQSSFYQALSCLMALVKDPWTKERLVSLFETKSFSLKNNLDPQCSIFLEKFFQSGLSWKEGAWQELKKVFYLSLGPIREAAAPTDLEEFEKCFSLLQALEEEILPMKEALWTLEVWAEKWKAIATKYLRSDFDNELDHSCQTHFFEKMDALSQVHASIKGKKVPFQILQDDLLKFPAGTIHGNCLHAVSFASLKEGAVVSSKAIFLLGMDEESFPRRKALSSLDLSKTTKQFIPGPADEDRYLILQALLNATEFLFFSYCQTSRKDGKLIGPSLVLQEIFRAAPCKEVFDKKSAPFYPQICLKIEKPLPLVEKQENSQVELSDLLAFARNPWKYYLQRVKKIFLKERSESSFAMQKGSLLRVRLEYPLDISLLEREKLPPLFDEAFFIDVKASQEERDAQLSRWGKEQVRILLLETAKEGVRGSSRQTVEALPLEVKMDDGRIYRISGHIPYALKDGALYPGHDKIGALLKSWPEILCSCIALKSDAIYFLKTGKIKRIEDPANALKRFLEYYEKCRSLLSPLMPDWADALLRKEPRDFSFDFEYEDRALQWVMFRLEKIDPFHLFEEWKWLRDSFQDLIGLYPKRASTK